MIVLSNVYPISIACLEINHEVLKVQVLERTPTKFDRQMLREVSFLHDTQSLSPYKLNFKLPLAQG